MAIYYFPYSTKVAQEQITIIFQCNPLAAPQICYLSPQVCWCHLQRIFLVAFEAMYELHPWPLHHLQSSIYMMHLWVVQKYGSQLGWDLDCMLGWGEAWISVFKLELLGPGWWRMFPLHALMFACRFIVLQPCFSSCDCLLQENLFFMILLQKLHAHFRVCPFALICKLLWYPPYTYFVIPKIPVDGGICMSTADVQLDICISDIYLFVLLNWSINSFNSVYHSWSGWITWAVIISSVYSDILEFSHPLVHLPLHKTVFSVLQ